MRTYSHVRDAYHTFPIMTLLLYSNTIQNKQVLQITQITLIRNPHKYTLIINLSRERTVIDANNVLLKPVMHTSIRYGEYIIITYQRLRTLTRVMSNSITHVYVR